jgi:serine/threonine protein kinase
MGTVYRARDRRTGRRIALKVVRDADADVERFEREARVLASLADPGIVSYVDHRRTAEGDPYLAMEWLEGEDLGARLARGDWPSATRGYSACESLERSGSCTRRASLTATSNRATCSFATAR